MTQNKKSKLLNTLLIIYAIIAVIYGIGYLFFPAAIVELSGGESIPSAWLRWSGGVIFALGIGAIFAYRDPFRQEAFIATIALGTLFTGLALLYSWIFEMIGSTWFIAASAIIILVLSAFLWWDWLKAK